MASGWKMLQSKLSTGLQGVDLSKTGNQITKSWGTFTQSARERLGTSEDITELPEDYKALEKRVDALRSAHASLLKVGRAFETNYDYPVNLGESASELGQGISYNLSFWAAQATKGTNLPQPVVSDKPAEVAKTLPHALSRAAASGAIELGGGVANAQGDKLSKSLQTFAVAEDKIGGIRVIQDQQISQSFLRPWNSLSVSLQATMKARQNVKNARLSLDSLRNNQKNLTAGDPRTEQARLEVEAAEEKLFNATEEAISLMRGVLESPEAIKAISALVKAQKDFFSQAASILAEIEPELDETARSAEEDFRKSRG